MTDGNIKDIVIKLEVQMQQMSKSLDTMATAIDKLAQVHHDLKQFASLSDSRYASVKEKMLEQDSDMDRLGARVAAVEKTAGKSEQFHTNLSRFMWMIATAVLAVTAWVIERSFI